MKKIIIIAFLYILSFAGEQNGSFIDTKHKLEWQDSVDVEKEQKWAMSKSYCKSLHYLGYDDWRLPSINELKTIVDTVRSPKPNEKFKYGTQSAYWTSEEYRHVNAWAIYVQTNHLFWNDKCDTAYVRCVRNRF